MNLFEKGLWQTRLIVMLAVIASMLTAIGMFYLTTIDVYHMLAHLTHYHELAQTERLELRSATVVHAVEAVDGYLLGTILLIFAMGLYELFISKIDTAKQSNLSGRILVVTSLDDLKDKLAKVIIMILVVKFFEKAIQMNFATPIDLLYFAIGILLVSAALYFVHLTKQKSGGKPGYNKGGRNYNNNRREQTPKDKA